MMRRDECLKALARHVGDADIVLPVYSTAFDWIDIRPSPLNYLSLATYESGMQKNRLLSVRRHLAAEPSLIDI